MLWNFKHGVVGVLVCFILLSAGYGVEPMLAALFGGK